MPPAHPPPPDTVGMGWDDYNCVIPEEGVFNDEIQNIPKNGAAVDPQYDSEEDEESMNTYKKKSDEEGSVRDVAACWE